MDIRCVAKFVRTAPGKVRRYADLIRGQSLTHAKAVLAVQSSPAATALAKVLKSAGANAENNHGLDTDALTVKYAQADDGVTMPRVRYRARGRAERIKRRSCHIVVVLTDGEE